MKEEYYIVPKKVLDDIVNLMEKQFNFTINNDCKLINLSDEAIEEKASESFKEQLHSYENDISDYPDDSVFKLIYGYRRALTDIKQQIK